MIQLLLHQDTLVKNFVASLIGNDEHFAPDATAIGVVDGPELLGGAIFSDYHMMTYGHDIRLHGAFKDGRWATRRILGSILAYPFHQLGCTRLTTITAKNNKKARALDERLGFRYVGKLSRGWDGRRDAIVYEMLKEECRWLKYAAVTYRTQGDS